MATKFHDSLHNIQYLEIVPNNCYLLVERTIINGRLNMLTSTETRTRTLSSKVNHCRAVLKPKSLWRPLRKSVIIVILSMKVLVCTSNEKKVHSPNIVQTTAKYHGHVWQHGLQPPDTMRGHEDSCQAEAAASLSPHRLVLRITCFYEGRIPSSLFAQIQLSSTEIHRALHHVWSPMSM